jgi:L-lactate dehydrogenase complex protein LldE
MHHVGLFIPCYLDAFEPEVGIAILELLERLGCTVDYPFDQTCCGQPMVNTGCHSEAAATERLFVANFTGYDYIVCPSGSCTHQVRANLTAIGQTEEVRKVRANIYELTEFLHDVLKVDALPWARFPHKVGMHYNCNSLRGLGLASPSELRQPRFSKPKELLSLVADIEFVQPSRPDECCRFGGTFCVFEPAVSAKMGYDKVADHAHAGAEYVVSADSSCLLHQKGCADRIGNPVANGEASVFTRTAIGRVMGLREHSYTASAGGRFFLAARSRASAFSAASRCFWWAGALISASWAARAAGSARRAALVAMRWR